jgi:patatin-like phospholipase/acyl hydrolase
MVASVLDVSMGNEEPIRRILTIDGGGIVGTFPAAFLAALEDNLGKGPIGQYFDLIVGTSTGGIIALGLAMGLPAAEVLRLYEEQGPTIFGQGSATHAARRPRAGSPVRGSTM